MKEKTRKLTVMAMLVAISVVLVYLIHFPIFPAAAFLEYDPADIPILIGAFAYGPVAGILLTGVASVIQGFTVSAGSGACVGFGVGLARACPTLSGSASILVSAFSCQSMR